MKVKRQHKDTTKNFNYTTIADLLKTVHQSNYCHTTGMGFFLFLFSYVLQKYFFLFVHILLYDIFLKFLLHKTKWNKDGTGKSVKSCSFENFHIIMNFHKIDQNRSVFKRLHLTLNLTVGNLCPLAWRSLRAAMAASFLQSFLLPASAVANVRVPTLTLILNLHNKNV